MFKYFYSLPEHGQDFDDARSFECEDDARQKWRLYYIAEIAAEKYHGYDGWEVGWPQKFELWTEKGESLGKFIVDRELAPIFRTIEMEK